MRRLCLIASCPHRHDDEWLHLPEPRRTPVLAHLRPLERAA